jgi:hypothetical protein
VNESIRETRVLAWHAAFAAAAAIVALVASSPKLVLGLALGAALQAVNFRALFGLARRAFAQQRAASGMALRLPLFGLALWLAIAAGVDAVGLVLGLSLIVPAVVIAAWQARPSRQPASELPALAPDDPAWEDWNAWLARERDSDEESP